MLSDRQANRAIGDQVRAFARGRWRRWRVVLRRPCRWPRPGRLEPQSVRRAEREASARDWHAARQGLAAEIIGLDVKCHRRNTGERTLLTGTEWPTNRPVAVRGLLSVRSDCLVQRTARPIGRRHLFGLLLVNRRFSEYCVVEVKGRARKEPRVTSSRRVGTRRGVVPHLPGSGCCERAERSIVCELSTSHAE